MVERGEAARGALPKGAALQRGLGRIVDPVVSEYLRVRVQWCSAAAGPSPPTRTPSLTLAPWPPPLRSCCHRSICCTSNSWQHPRATWVTSSQTLWGWPTTWRRSTSSTLRCWPRSTAGSRWRTGWAPPRTLRARWRRRRSGSTRSSCWQHSMRSTSSCRWVGVWGGVGGVLGNQVVGMGISELLSLWACQRNAAGEGA